MDLSRCRLCPRRCGADRAGGKYGYCGAGMDVRVALAAIHEWEEPCISGKGGAGAVFFSYCSLRCVFCQNADISDGGLGEDVGISRLAGIFRELQAKGASTLDLVTPTHYAPQILEAVREAKNRGLKIPVVWNSSGYELPEIIREVSGAVDVYLPDLKYMDEDSADMYSHAEDYFSHASSAIREMVRLAGAPVYDDDGTMKRGVLIRHMILPSRRHESMRIVRWIWENFKDSVVISLMRQYTPLHRAGDFPKIARPLTTFEYESVVDYAVSLGVTRCYVQQAGAASSRFVPSFDGRGVTSPDDSPKRHLTL